jgi:hypothetical protein
MSDRVVFYQLSARFLNKGQTVPPDAEQVLYYSLGIGHHVGVIDTFKPIMDCRYDSYMAAVAVLPEGEARRKLESSEEPSALLVRISMQKQKSGPIGSIRPCKQLIGSRLST